MKEDIAKEIAVILGWDWESLGEQQWEMCNNYAICFTRVIIYNLSEKIEQLKDDSFGSSKLHEAYISGYHHCRKEALNLLQAELK